VSARGRDIGASPYDDFIQIDASVNKGNSGGPTFDMGGNVIGVNTAIFSPSGGSVGIAFDIPSDTVKSVVAQLKDKGVVSRGWIGVRIQPVTVSESLGMKGSEGALVTEAQAGSPAVKGGIESFDVITSVNGHVVKEKRCTWWAGCVQAAPETRRALLICRIQPGLDVQIAQRTISVTRLLQQRTRLVTGILL
jgi:serine protease Do